MELMLPEKGCRPCAHNMATRLSDGICCHERRVEGGPKPGVECRVMPLAMVRAMVRAVRFEGLISALERMSERG